ncbi:MAG: protein BatD [Bacteroidales bacterium]|nr:protein BatD [Bacteroidales bacterium]
MMTNVRKPKRLIAAALAACSILAAQAAANRPAGGVSVTASIDSAVIVMGDRAHLRVNVDMPQAVAKSARLVDFPILPPGREYLEFNGVDVVASDSATNIDGEKRRIKFDFTIQAFDPGTVTIPPFAVVATPGADTAFSNVVTFKVLPVELDSLATLNPIESIVSPNSRWYDYIPNWLLWTLLVLALGAAGAWAFFYFRKAKETIELRKNPPIPPYELAVSRLNRLKSQNLPETGREKQYYTELVDILRQYLQGRFGINAMEMTSTQIVKSLRSNPETRMTADEMRAVLSIADFVKFAKVRPLPDDNVKAFNRATAFVEQTKPAPEPETEEPAKPIDSNKSK